MIGWLFTNGLALLGVGGGWLNPFVGLMVFYAFSMLRPGDLWFWSWGGSVPRYSFMVALSTLAGTFMVGVWKGLGKATAPLLGLYLYIFSGIFATYFTAINTAWSQQWIYTQITIVIMFTIGLAVVRSAGDLRAMAWVIVACQGYGAWVLNSQYHFDGFNRIYLKGFAGGDNNGGAMTFVMAVPLTFFLAVQEKQWWVKLLCLAAVLMDMHVILLSFSRGAQLGLILVGLAVFVLVLVSLPHKGLTIMLAIVFVIAGFYLAGPEVRERFMTIMPFLGEKGAREASAESRFNTWGGAWACIKDHPLGVGPRGFNLVSIRYGLDRNKSVHNLFLQTAADYGVLGALGLLWFYLSSMWLSFRLAFHPTSKRLVWPRFYGHMCCLSLGGLMVCSEFIGMESIELGYIVALLGVATACYVDRVAQVDNLVALHPPLELAQVPAPRSGEEDEPPAPEWTPALT